MKPAARRLMRRYFAYRKLRAEERSARREIARRWLKQPPARAHGLNGTLIVSLASYRKRFATLLPTLQCLMTQTMQADKLVLWIPQEDQAFIPADIRSLAGKRNFEIRIAPDLKSFNKIIPALEAFPDAYIVTADDDIHYADTWLAGLVEACDPFKQQIVCYRAHGMRVRDGKLLPYQRWDWEAKQFSETVMFPTGGAGILYCPKSLDPQTTNTMLFQSLCPSGDDIWLAWMGHLAGSEYVKVKLARPLHFWRGSQDVGLNNHNVHKGGNDVQLAAMVRHFGIISRGNYLVRS